MPVFAILGAMAFAALVVSMIRRGGARHERERAASFESIRNLADDFARTSPEPDSLAETLNRAAEKLFAFDALEIGIVESRQYRRLRRKVRGSEQPQPDEVDASAEWMVELIVAEGQPRIAGEPLPEGLLPLSEAEAGSTLLIPIPASGGLQGLLALQHERPGFYDEKDLEMGQLLQSLASPGLERVHLAREVKRRAGQMVVLSELSRQLISLRPLEDRLAEVTPLISQLLGFPAVRVYEWLGGEAVLRGVTHGMADRAEPIEEEPAIVRESAQRREMIRSGGDDGRGDGAVEEIALPLMIEDHLLGVLHLTSGSRGQFSDEELALAEMLAAQLAIASLEARNFAQQQEFTWINTVLLEVARHAARPGDPEASLRAVLQLTTLLAGADWVVLLTPGEDDSSLRIGPSSGLPRSDLQAIEGMSFPPEAFGIGPPYHESEAPTQLLLPEPLTAILHRAACPGLVLTDGQTLLGLMLVGGPEPTGARGALLAGIGHQVSLRIENSRLVEVVAAQRSLERELAMARNIQESFLPRALPNHPGWDVGAVWLAARQVGGDFYDFIPLPAGEGRPCWGVAIADVSDKGVPAALFMALCRTLLRSAASSRVDPGETLTRLNQMLFAQARPDFFVSLAYAVWEPDAGRLRYANAGHNPPLILQPDGSIRSLSEHGMVLGVIESAEYMSHEVSLPVASTLLLYTDGVTEAANDRGELFGLDRLLSVVRSAGSTPAQALAEKITQAVIEYADAPEPSDDLTTVILTHTNRSVHDP